MKKIGLTGGMGMGKSAVTKWLLSKNIPVYDADARVHWLYANDTTLIKRIGTLVPGSVVDGKVDRKVLSQWVMRNKNGLRQIEKLVGPALIADRRAWMRNHQLHGSKLVVADIPILFESTRRNEWDEIICVDVLPVWQRQRIMRRPGMTVQKMSFILGKQWSNARRLAHSTHVVYTGLSWYGTRKMLLSLF